MALPADGQIRVMLVDAHRIVLSGLKRIIEDEKPHLAVVATATDRAGALEHAHTAKPDVVVLDVRLTEDKDADVIPTLINGRNTRVLILS
ncbi:MAG TPA: response regulator [Burkholderiales bacterium]|nr:response regulator [Burkholderiales bacterium]